MSHLPSPDDCVSRCSLKSRRGYSKQKRSIGNKTVIDRNDYGWYDSEYQSKCDRAPAVWLFPDIWKTKREGELGRWNEEGRIHNFVLLTAAPAGLHKLQLVEFIKPHTMIIHYYDYCYFYYSHEMHLRKWAKAKASPQNRCVVRMSGCFGNIRIWN